MKVLLITLTITYILALSKATPAKLVTTSTQEEDHELIGGFVEGDMEIDIARNGIISESRRWPNNEVFYKIEPIFDEAHIYHILSAMLKIEEASCIRFYPALENMTAYVNFTNEPTGCHSQVGYLGRMQKLNLQLDPLDTGCFRLGTLQHEILHTLGFRHQQCSANRDDYVTIIEENIIEGQASSFMKYDASILTNFDIEYDYASILHYGPKAFSKNGLPTIVPHPNAEIEIGQRREMSKADIDKLNIMYKCLREI